MFKKFLTLAFSALLFSSFAIADQYAIDPAHSQVTFKIPHLMLFKVRGSFSDFKGTIEANPAAKTIQMAQATIKVASIDTRQPKRDNHLRSADFFDVEKFPEITFKSTRTEGHGDSIKVYGDLTIHGVSKAVVLKGEFLGSNKDPWGNERAGFEASTKIDRRDFGLTWNKALESGGVVVGEEVTISLEVEAVKQK